MSLQQLLKPSRLIILHRYKQYIADFYTKNGNWGSAQKSNLPCSNFEAGSPFPSPENFTHLHIVHKPAALNSRVSLR